MSLSNLYLPHSSELQAFEKVQEDQLKGQRNVVSDVSDHEKKEVYKGKGYLFKFYKQIILTDEIAKWHSSWMLV